MSDARELSTQAFTEEELNFLQAIKRTQEETSSPPGMNVDVGRIAAKAFASYLEGLDQRVPDPEPKVKGAERRRLSEEAQLISVLTRSTLGLNKTVAELSEPEESVQFGRDFFYSVIPTLMVGLLGAGYLLFRSRLNVSSELLVNVATVCTLLAAMALTAGFFMDRNRLSSHLRSLRYSGGALVGGLAVATLGLLSVNFGLQQKWKWQQNVNETKIESTSRAMAEVGFATVERQADANLEEKTRMNFVGLENSAVELKSDKTAGAVKVEAKPDNVPTSVILNIEPYRANVYSANAAEPDYKILTGTVQNYSKNVIEIKADDSTVKAPIKINLADSSEQLMLADLENIKQTGLQGQDVKVLFVPKNSQAIKMSLLRQGVAPRIIYNADSANLKTAAIAP